MGLLVPVNDSATSEVVGRKLNDHPILRQDADVVLPHLAADVGEDLVSFSSSMRNIAIGQRFDNASLDLDGPVFLRHILRDPGLRLPASPVESLSIRYGDDTPSPEVIVVHSPGPTRSPEQ